MYSTCRWYDRLSVCRYLEKPWFHNQASAYHATSGQTSGDATVLPHWGQVAHICVSKLTIIGSYNGLSPGRRPAIIWTNTGILLIGPSRINFSEILIEMRIFSFIENAFENIVCKMLVISSRPQCVKTQSMQESSSLRSDPFPSAWGESSLQCAIRVYNRFLPSLWHRESILFKLTDFCHTVDVLIKRLMVGWWWWSGCWSWMRCDGTFTGGCYSINGVPLKLILISNPVKSRSIIHRHNWCYKWTIFREIWVYHEFWKNIFYCNNPQFPELTTTNE